MPVCSGHSEGYQATAAAGHHATLNSVSLIILLAVIKCYPKQCWSLLGQGGEKLKEARKREREWRECKAEER